MSGFFDGTAFPEASAGNAFSGNRLVRNSEHLGAGDLADAWRHPKARIHLFHNGDPVLRSGGTGSVAAFTLQEAAVLNYDAAAGIYLGDRDGMPFLAATIASPDPLPAPYGTLDMRSMVISGSVAAEDVASIAHGWSLLSWHANNRFCAHCGEVCKITQAGYRRSCTACGREHFPRLDPVSIMLVVDGGKCLLGRQPRFQPGMYSCLAGFIEPGETLEDAVRREIMEEAGIEISAVRYHSTQPWPFPHTLMIGCFARADSTAITMDAAELEDCRWFGREEIGAMLNGSGDLKTPPPMAIAHQLIRTFYEFSS